MPRAPAIQTPDLGNMPTAHFPLGAFPYVQWIEAAMLFIPPEINFANIFPPPFFSREGNGIQEFAIPSNTKSLQYFRLDNLKGFPLEKIKERNLYIIFLVVETFPVINENQKVTASSNRKSEYPNLLK